MKFHQKIAEMIDTNEIVVLSDGLNVEGIVNYIQGRVLQISISQNSFHQKTPVQRQNGYSSTQNISATSAIIQTDFLQKILKLNSFDNLLAINPDNATIFLINNLFYNFKGKIIILYDSPLFLIKYTNITNLLPRIKLQVTDKRLFLVPRIEKNVNEELVVKNQVSASYINQTISEIISHLFNLIKNYCQLGKTEFHYQIVKLTFNQFLQSPYIYSDDKFIQAILYVMYQVEFESEIVISACLNQALEFIDNTQFTFKNFDYSVVRDTFRLIHQLLPKISDTPSLFDQIRQIEDQHDQISLIFPTDIYLQNYINNTSTASQDIILNQKLIVTSKYFSCRRSMQFDKPSFVPFQLRENTAILAIGPTLSALRQIEQISALSGKIYYLETPFISNLTISAAKFESYAFSLLRTQQPYLAKQPYIETKKHLLIDTRELKSQIPLQLHNLGVEIQIQQLKTADYVLDPNFGLERKSASDLISSLISKRIFYQLERLNIVFARPGLLLEVGENHEIFANPELLQQFLAAVQRWPKIRLFWSRKPENMLQKLASAEAFKFAEEEARDSFSKFINQIDFLKSKDRKVICEKFNSLRELILCDFDVLVVRLGKSVAGRLNQLFDVKIALE